MFSNKKRVIYLITISLFTGLLIGLILSLSDIISNQYLKYKTTRLIGLSLQNALNKWISLSLILIPPLFLLSKKGLEFTAKILLKKDARYQKFEIFDDQTKFKFRFAIFSICLGIFLSSGWAINRLVLPAKLHPLSLLGDAGILLITILLGWLISKLAWKSVFGFIKRCTQVLVISLVGLNLFNFVFIHNSNPIGPNVILIVVDTLRADHLSCYGYGRKTSPRIDEFASDSILFNNAISMAPWTAPSIASIFTGCYPAYLGFVNEPIVLDNRYLTLAEVFKENNYKTKGIVSHIYVSSRLGFNQGFDSYDEKNAKGHGFISSPPVIKSAISFIEENKRSKFFLFLHLFDPHFDYILHPGYDFFPDYDGSLYSGQPINELRERAPYLSKKDIEYINGLYDSEIAFTDYHIGLLLDKVKKLGLYNNSIIIFTADHGEEFSERGDHWIGHTKKLFQEQIHVPLIIKGRNNNKKRIVNEYIGLIDVMPSILNMAGLQMPDRNSIQGNIIDIDMIEKLKDRFIISETRRGASLQSTIYEGWKYIYDSNNDLKYLFNLMQDPKEINNMQFSKNSVLMLLERYSQNWASSFKTETTKRKKPTFTDKQKERLRSLGYIK